MCVVGSDETRTLQELGSDQAARAAGVNTAGSELGEVVNVDFAASQLQSLGADQSGAACPKCGKKLQVCVTLSSQGFRYELIQVCAKCGIASDGISPEELFARLAVAEHKLTALANAAEHLVNSTMGTAQWYSARGALAELAVAEVGK